MARGRAGCTTRGSRARRRGADLITTDAHRAAADTWLSRTIDEVHDEYRARFERHLLRRCNIAHLADVPGTLDSADDLRHLARDLHVLGEPALALRVLHAVDPDARTAARMYHPREDADLLRRQGSDDLYPGERAEVAERIRGHCRHLIEREEFAEAVAMADAWRTYAGIQIHGPRPDPARSFAITQKLFGAWAVCMYTPTPEESLARIGYMDEWDLSRAGWSRATGDLGEFGDPRGPHRHHLRRTATLEEFEHAARAAIDHPDLFGGVEPARACENVRIPLALDQLERFAESYADDPAFLGWAVAYSIRPNPWPYPDDNDALFQQSVYITGLIRAQTPHGERTVTMCAHVGDYYTDEADTHLADQIARTHMDPLGIRSGVTMPLDDTVARDTPSDHPLRGGRMIERGSDIIRTPTCDHAGAQWQPGALRDSSGHIGKHDTLSLDCPHCGARRLAAVAVHRAPDAPIDDARWYLQREMMHTRLSGAARAGDLNALRKRDGMADMSLWVNLPGVGPLEQGEDLATSLFG